jgi:hypothetical protein
LPLGPYTDFRGISVDETSILIAYTRTGDANLDGLVNDEDVTILNATYAPGVPQPDWALGDFDYNGFVDNDDVTLLGTFYNPTATPLPAPVGQTSPALQPTVVPLAQPLRCTRDGSFRDITTIDEREGYRTYALAIEQLLAETDQLFTSKRKQNFYSFLNASPPKSIFGM